MLEEFWPYGGNETADDTALILNGLAKCCACCNRVTANMFLKEDKCPVCRDTTVSEPGLQGFGTNAGVRCDRPTGPCSCGAWH